MLKRSFCPISLVCLGLVGCATQPEALVQANNTVGLMSSLDGQLAEFRRSWSALEESRVETLKTQRRLMASTEFDAERSRLARIAAGDTGGEALRVQLLANVDAIQAAKTNAAKDEQSSEQKLKALLQPIPSTSASITAAQKSAAKMGSEVSRQDRAKELLAFVEEVKAGIDKAKKAQKDAKDAASKTAEKIVSTD